MQEECGHTRSSSRWNIHAGGCSRRSFLAGALAAGGGLAGSRRSLGAETPDPRRAVARRPNFVVILTDDQGYGDLGCFGSKRVRTPNIDRMAREGVRFTDFSAAAPRCGPSRAALMTGRYPHRNNCMRQFMGKVPGLPLGEVTVANVLKQAGYRTACIGKWHLGSGPKYLPMARGFDSWFGMQNHSNYRGPRHPDRVLYRNGQTIDEDPDKNTLTRLFTEEAVRVIADKDDAPFFLYLAHPMPHIPIGCSPAFGTGYAGAIAELDWSVGEVLKAIEARGVEHDTLVVYASDNGKAKSGSSGPLRGGKFDVYEGGMRVPCVARWPGRIPPKQVCRHTATTMDLLPTFAALAKAKLPRDRVLDGHDIRPLLFGKRDAASPYEAFFYYGPLAVRAGKWKLHLGREKAANRALKIEQLWRPKMASETELYDLEKDIGERTSPISTRRSWRGSSR